MRRRLTYLFLTILLVFVFRSLAQQSKIDLRRADSLEVKTLNGEEVRELIGNVHFVQFPTSGGLVKVWCDRALRYMEQN